jgi:hypothetical protein
MAITRKSQPSGLPGWRRATSHPTAAQGMPIAAAIARLPSTRLPAGRAGRASGIMAAPDRTARMPSTTLHARGDPRRKLMDRPYVRIVPGTLRHSAEPRGPPRRAGARRAVLRRLPPPRAASFEHRIAALACDPAQPDMGVHIPGGLTGEIALPS